MLGKELAEKKKIVKKRTTMKQKIFDDVELISAKEKTIQRQQRELSSTKSELAQKQQLLVEAISEI